MGLDGASAPYSSRSSQLWHPSMPNMTGPECPASMPARLMTVPRPCPAQASRRYCCAGVCLSVLGRENHPLTGYHWVLLPWSPLCMRAAAWWDFGSGQGSGRGAQLLTHSLVAVGVVYARCSGPFGACRALFGGLICVVDQGSQPSGHSDMRGHAAKPPHNYKVQGQLLLAGRLGRAYTVESIGQLRKRA